jgi:hypothetical protein
VLIIFALNKVIARKTKRSMIDKKICIYLDLSFNQRTSD